MMNVNNNSEIKIETPASNGYMETGFENEIISFKDALEGLLDKDDDYEQKNSIEALPVEFFGINPVSENNCKIDADNIENTDAMFLLNISTAPENTNLILNNDGSVIDATNYKTLEVSKTLGDALIKASESNKALRLDFDEHITVVLKVSKEGKIDANFIPQNKDVETYLKNNIDYLKVRFDEQNIAYSNISYKPYKKNKNDKQGDK